MKKIRFGTPEEFVPTKFCKNLNYQETDIQYDLSKITYKQTNRGCVIELPLQYQEEVYGFGLQLKGFRHKGTKKTLRTNSDPVANTGDSHAPVPFFVTTNGYGIYLDTARNATFYCGYGKNKNRPPKPNNAVTVTAEALYEKTALEEDTVMAIEIPYAKGIDLYLFEGDTITDIVAQYNQFSGGGCDVPEWGLGVYYRCYVKSTGDQVMEQAKYFRDNQIPCDVIGLEPGWHSRSYPCSYQWDSERFPNYREVVEYLRKNDFHINLWEHAFIDATSPLYHEMKEHSGDFEVWQGLVPDFVTEEARKRFSDYHRKHLIDLGIDGFKLDECDNSDFVLDWSFPDCIEFPSGIDGDVYHNLFGTLYMQTMLEALGEHETFSEVRQAGALASSYPFVLYSDLYDHRDFIRGVVNCGFSGLLWTPEVREGKTKTDFIRRLQTAVFSVQCLINAWYCEQAPWLEFGCEEEVKALLNERKKLIPTLKKAFEKYHRTGIPPVRALVMDYTADPETYGIDDEYLLGDSLLVAPMTAEQSQRRVYLPKGEWTDYWTGKTVPSGWLDVRTDNIPVYVKAER
ncbi:Alpha-xylosidase [uncultured Ruminococcus sp.]|uniref:TIM-barrel domain-containing protein n=1 Tax=Massiliimalia timonensis TaxID=1987501 RepID=UPI000820D484|nr:TIM-barrel domain-containing protein [Massiliimalia timonensis]SCH64103.1 Alpha-xylosidase [uncultured Clostridium sp.]SCH79030.1 Alpha-xylosidase [uncultured Ruminococcus sp.]